MHTTSDIHSYSVFANIHDREKDEIKGYMLFLTKEAYEAIEQIVLNQKSVKVKDKPTYKVGNDK